MVFYAGIRYSRAAVGSTLAQVVCEKCSCEYFYELARVGKGSATSHYAIGMSSAKESAAQLSRKDLGKRLSSEAELVPCPKCRWVSEELIVGYRLGRYRRWLAAAAAIAFFGTIGCLTASWFLSIGPAADRGALPYVLIGGPAACLAIAVSIILLRNHLRARIQPNRNHPDPSEPPPGTPPALWIDEASGEIVPADDRSRWTPSVRGWFDYQIGRDQLPQICCACLQPYSEDSEFIVKVAAELGLKAPLCRACNRNRRRRQMLMTLAIAACLIAAAFGVLLILKPDEVVFWIAGAAACIVAPLIGLAVGYRRAAPVLVKPVDLARGILTLSFRNDAYRTLLSEHPRRPLQTETSDALLDPHSSLGI